MTDRRWTNLSAILFGTLVMLAAFAVATVFVAVAAGAVAALVGSLVIPETDD